MLFSKFFKKSRPNDNSRGNGESGNAHEPLSEERGYKKTVKGDNSMPNKEEIKKDEEVITKTEQEDGQNKATATEQVDEKKEYKAPEVETETETEEEAQEPKNIGIPLSDIATKQDLAGLQTLIADLATKLEAMNAKNGALVKENEGLTNKIEELHDKYERHDFGNYQKQGMSTTKESRSANLSFEEYSKQFK